MTEGWLRATGLGAMCALSACASDAPPAAQTATEPAVRATPRESWPRFAEVASFPALNERAFPTRGHLVKPSHAIVRASPEARADYLALVTDSVLPDGATIAMFHESRDGKDKGFVYVMEKHDGDWTFLALDSDGNIASENVNVCALCHRGGVADHLFGLPRNLAPPAR